MSGKPAAMFVGDTLAVVWSEIRDGALDVFGSFVRLPPNAYGVAVPHEAIDPRPGNISRPLIIGLAPNPARGSISVAFELVRRSGVAVEIISIQGKLERRIELGELHGGRHTEQIPLDGTLPGNYILRLVSGFGSVTTKLVVAPQP
jgi:hypothetical protein